MRWRFDEYHVDGDRQYEVILYTHEDDYEPLYLTAGKHYHEHKIGTISYYPSYGNWYFRGYDLSAADMKRLINFMDNIEPWTKEEWDNYNSYSGDPLAR